MPLIPHTLGAGWSPAELSAMHLDAEVLPVGGGYQPVDQPLTPAARAGSLADCLPASLILELESAAWVYGACEEPMRHTVAVDARARIRTTMLTGVRLRETVVRSEQLLLLAGRRVTSPAHTVIELARRAEATPPALARLLAELTQLDPLELQRSLRQRSALPHKHRALQRLRCWFPETLAAAEPSDLSAVSPASRPAAGPRPG